MKLENTDTSIVVIDSDDVPAQNTFKKMAYGGSRGKVMDANGYRLERGKPFLRGGQYVYATPQFKGLTLFSPISNNVQLPGTTTTPTSVTYPTRITS